MTQEKRIVRTTDAPRPQGPYSQGIAVGQFVFVAGQGPIDPASNTVRGDTIEEQTELTLSNIRAILQAGGADMADVVKSTVHLANLDDFAAFNRVYETFFPEPRPVRTTVGSKLMGILVEIDVIAIARS